MSRLAVLALGALGLAGLAADAGAPLVITGVVTDNRGRALPSVQVTLEAARSGISLRTLRRAQRQVQRVSTRTNERGEYSLGWPRGSAYNSFALLAEAPSLEAGGEALHELARVDLTTRLRRATGPLVVALSVADTSFLDALTAFLAALESDDERRVYQTLGRPDSVDTVRFADRVEASWWYFAAGKVVRFRDGRVAEETAFEPVRPFVPDR